MSYILNICLCSAEAGYPHDPCCPYPLYRATEADEAAWEAAFAARRAILPSGEPEDLAFTLVLNGSPK